MNKIGNDKQCTILWYVDKLKISNVDTDIISIVFVEIDAEYGNIEK